MKFVYQLKLRSILIPMFVLGILTFANRDLRADDWPQWLGPKRDGVWREKGILDKFPPSGPKYRWRTPIGEGYSGPVVANGKVYVADRLLAQGSRNPKNPFGRSVVDGKERILCLDEKNGKILWKHEYECPYNVSYGAGPRCSPVVADGKVYALGAMGDLVCLDAKSGDEIWSKNFPKEMKAEVPLWGFSSSPLVDGDRLICLVGGNLGTVVAFDKDTGKVLWSALDASHIGYAPPMIYEYQGKRQLIIWHPESINGLNPKTGDVYWTQPFLTRNGKPLRAALSIPTPRKEGDKLFLTAFYDGPMMVKVGENGPSVLWRGKGRSEQPDGTDGLHAIMCTPVIQDGYIYGVGSYGELRCLDGKTGERQWSTLKATGGRLLRWANAFLVPHDDRFFLFNERGELIIAKLTPDGYTEISRTKILEPTNTMAGPAGRRVVWSHPAFANQSVYARNDREIVCVSLKSR